MVKKIFTVISVLLIVISLSACNLNEKNDDLTDVNTVTSTEKITKIHNDFKDTIPDYRFDNEPVENYNEGMSYSFSVKCSEKEFKKYVKEIKKAGYEENAVEAEGYYYAYNPQSYFAEITYVGEIMTVFVKRV